MQICKFIWEIPGISQMLSYETLQNFKIEGATEKFKNQQRFLF